MDRTHAASPQLHTNTPVIQTDSASSGQASGPPPVISGGDLYQLLMSRIEPDLTQENLPSLPEKYKSETPDARRTRIERYNRAFRLYEEELQKYKADWDQKFADYRRTALQSFEQISATTEESGLCALESQMNNT